MSAVSAPALAGDLDVDVAYLQPVHYAYPDPYLVHAPRYGWAYVAPRAPVTPGPRCYRTQHVNPNGTVIYRRVCL